MPPTAASSQCRSHDALRRRRMLEEVAAGLSTAPKTLPSKYFYDDAGSRLFDRITELDEYYLTRAETAIMERHAPDMAREMGSGVRLVEFGSGSSAKTRILLQAMHRPAAYVPVDISAEYLEQVAQRLRRAHPGVPILPLPADFTGPLELPALPGRPARSVVYFPGSTIGNFQVLEASRLLTRMRRLAGPGGGVLMGFDLLKPLARLLPAYNDEAGVTAEFNLNLLRHLNRELDTDFDLEGFRHDAPFNPRASRIEMHLVSLKHQTVRVGDRTFTFRAGERLVTEYSHKYTPESFAELAESAGLAARRSWTDPEELFCVQWMEAGP